ncbi:uncharacterized protein LOC105184523 isoform X2 [Harpegnathos saltator]|nr:uncharacterized protein LOC105184523 isoform X2 [Harpegnathos saltator]
MKKIIQKSSKNSKWYNLNTNVCKKESDPIVRSPSTHTVRRMTIRNRLFMKHITDQISMGEASSIINGAIEVTNVEITADFKKVNVFWNQISDVLISPEILQKCALIIRHELSQLRVIGVVPPIYFVRDKQHLIQQEVEKKLAMIESDLHDFEVLSYSEQIELAALHISQDVHKEPTMDNDSESDGSYLELPVMRQDVLGLDHHKIMTRIVASKSKSKAAAQRRMLEVNTDTDNSPCNVTGKIADFMTKKEQQELFKNFLKQRRVEEKRMYRMKQSSKQQLLNQYEEDNLETNFDNKYNYEDEFSDNYENKTKSS